MNIGDKLAKLTHPEAKALRKLFTEGGEPPEASGAGMKKPPKKPSPLVAATGEPQWVDGYNFDGEEMDRAIKTLDDRAEREAKSR